jgi:tRNA uridine 5-carbamoylmethylation protein Kti12
MVDIHAAVEMILAGRQRIPAHESMLVAVSGIDGSGKGYVTERLAACLQQRAVNAVAVNADGWLNLVPWQWRRSSDHRAGRSALDKAIRTDPYCAADT